MLDTRLSNRVKKVVRVNGQMSNEENEDRGVLQGSSLGQMIFLFLIADIDDYLDFCISYLLCS